MHASLRSALLSATIGPAVALAQEPLEADRPDQTESPAIVPTGWLQVETGVVREASGSGTTTLHNWSAPAALLKVGLGRRVESRLVVEHVVLGTNADAPATAGLLPVELGAKVALCDEHRLRPRTSLIAHFGVPWLAHPDLDVARYYTTFRFTMQHTLSDRLSLGYNLGAEQDGEGPAMAGIYTCTLGVELSARASGYVEAYGTLSAGAVPDHRVDGGFTFRCGPDVLLDASAGRCIDAADPWYVSIGFSFRCPVFRARTTMG